MLKVLMFHRVGEQLFYKDLGPEEKNLISLRTFKNIIRSIGQEKFLKADELLAESGKEKINSNKIYYIVSFDDGYKCTKEYAFPFLKSLGIPFIVFVCPGFVKREAFSAEYELANILSRVNIFWINKDNKVKTDDWEEKKKVYSELWPQLKWDPPLEKQKKVESILNINQVSPITDKIFLDSFELNFFSKQDFVEVGNHSFSHSPLTSMDRHSSLKEIYDSSEIISSVTGEYPLFFSYPFGNIPKWAPVSIENELGMFGAFSTDSMVIPDYSQISWWNIGRIDWSLVAKKEM